jgi:hypothetical protein
LPGIDAGTIISDLSDHFINYLILPGTVPKSKNKEREVRNFSEENKENFRLALSSINWAFVTSLDDVNDAFSAFWETFNSLYEIYFPLTKRKFNKNIHRINAYMTTGLLKSRLTKLNLYKLAVSTGLCSDYDRYKTYRNVYNSLLRLRKKLFYGESLQNASKNPKKIWQILNEITSRKACSNKIEKIIANGNLISDGKLMAEEFNNFFSTVGKKISDSVEPVGVDPMSFLNDENVYPDMEFENIGPSFLCDIINEFVPKKSFDIDGISMNLVKFISTSISVPLAHIYSLSLRNGIFPEFLKISRVVPIFKGGDPELCDNYRPISLVKTFAKLLEKIVSKKLTHHLKVNNIIDPLQFGFQSGLSTEHNLLQLTNFVTNVLNENKYAIGVFLDLKKAFDVVPHSILLKKLKYYGMKNNVF